MTLPALAATSADMNLTSAIASAIARGQLNAGWVILLALGFPLLMLLLGEALRWLERTRPAYTAPLAIVRHWILPALALYLFLAELIGRPRSAVGVRISETLVWIALILAALSLLNVVLFEGAPAGSWQAKVPKLFRDLGRFLLVLCGSAIVLSSVWGADLGGFLTALGVGSLVLGLALQDSLGNIFSGVALLFEQPIGMGDWIQIGDSLGKVVEVNWRSVHLQTTNDDLMVIPNAELAKGQFTNFSRPTAMHRVEIPMSFSYDDPPNKVRQLLIQTTAEIDQVLPKPAANVVVTGYGDFAVNYMLTFFAPDFSSGEDIRDELHRRIWYVAKRHGLTMPYPIQQQIIHAAPATTDQQQRSLLRLLQGTPGFATLSSDRLRRLIEQSQIRSYASQEVVIHRGMPLDGLYLIVSGAAELIGRDSLERDFSLGMLLAGECFGEKSSLLHGRSADTSVLAAEDLDVLVIPSEPLQEVLLQSPRLAADLSEIIEIRRRALEAVLVKSMPRPQASGSAGGSLRPATAELHEAWAPEA